MALKVKIKRLSSNSNTVFVQWPASGAWYPLGIYVYSEEERPGPVNDHIRCVGDLLWSFCDEFNRHLEFPMKIGQEVVFELAVKLAPKEVK